MYIVTSKSHSECLVWKYKNLEIAKKDYKERKRLKYKEVNLSEVIL